MNAMKKLRKGQTMVEYIIIVCLIAVALIGVFSYMSRAVGKKAAYAAEKIDSTEGGKAKNEAEGLGQGSDAIKDLQ